MANEKQKYPWWKRILLALIVIAMVLVAGLMAVRPLVAWRLSNEIARIAKAGEPLSFSDLDQPATTENAANYYSRALAKINPNIAQDISKANTIYRNKMASSEDGQVPNDLDTQTANILAPLLPTLKEIDMAAELDISGFDIGIKGGMEKCKANLEKLRTITLAMSLRTIQLIANNADDPAADSIISVLKLTRTFDSPAVIATSPIKTASLKLIYQDVYTLLKYGEPSAASLEKLQRTLSEVMPADCLEKTFLAERVYQLEIIRNLIPLNTASQYLQNAADIPERMLAPGSPRGLMLYRFKSTGFLRDMAKIIKLARKPWPGPLDTIVSQNSAAKTGSLARSASVVVQLTAESLIDTRCVMLAVAIERYHHLKNKLPDSLGDLVPAYIDSVPLDPFTGGSLMYKLDADIYTIYSTGSNRLDDSGSIIPVNNQENPLDKGIQVNFYKTK